jgi:hypothetical protein
LEAELAKVKDAELTLRLEFEQRLAKEKEALSAKYDTKVEELRVAQDAKNKEHDAKLLELMDLREADGAKYPEELGVWQGWDRRNHSILHGLDDALLGELSFFASPLLFPYASALLTCILAEAFPHSSDAATIIVEKCWEEYNIVRDRDSTAELSSVELAASVKG